MMPKTIFRASSDVVPGLEKVALYGPIKPTGLGGKRDGIVDHYSIIQ